MSDYNPLISAQLEDIEESWGDSDENREDMIRTGIKSLDQLIYGIDSKGELIIVQGKEKHRKTTLVANWIINMALDKNNRKKHIVIDTLESQMDYMRYRDTLLAMLMTKNLIEQTAHKRMGCPICKGTCEILGKLSPEFFRYRRDLITDKAKFDFGNALEYAKYILKNSNIAIYDGRMKQGNTRDIMASRERWVQLREDGKLDVLFIDHSQQFMIPRVSSGDHFTHLNTVVELVSTVITQYGFPIVLLSQISKNSQLDASSPADFQATGGAKANQEASVVITTEKTSNSAFTAHIGTSRVSGTGKIPFRRVDPPSGFIEDIDAKLETY